MLPDLREGLLPARPPDRCETLCRAALPLCVTCSAIGMGFMKASQSYASLTLLAIGYAMEIVAFGVYPFALRVYELRVVTTVWSASSVCTSLVCGYALFGERPSVVSAVGCAVMIAGVYLVHQ